MVEVIILPFNRQEELIFIYLQNFACYTMCLVLTTLQNVCQGHNNRTCIILVSVVHVCAHCVNLTNLTESFSQDVSKLEQRLSQLDDPWINPIRESGLVSLGRDVLNE